MPLVPAASSRLVSSRSLVNEKGEMRDPGVLDFSAATIAHEGGGCYMPFPFPVEETYGTRGRVPVAVEFRRGGGDAGKGRGKGSSSTSSSSYSYSYSSSSSSTSSAAVPYAARS